MSGEIPAVREALAVYATEALETERVPPGYRQTEVGVIPEDWEVNRLQDFGQWKGGATPSMRNPAYWIGGTIPWASSGDIKVVLLEETHLKITEAAVKQTSTSLLPKDSIIVVTRSGILRKYLPVAKNIVPLAINQDLKALLPSHDIEADFVLHQLTANGPKILATCQKAGTTVESVEYSWLKAFLIPTPSTQVEQRAIAAALSDVDALIAALDKLIAKKRAVKTAAMQQLVTGKQRLPGFRGEWEVKRLGDVFTLLSTASNSRSDLTEHGEVGYIHYGDIHGTDMSFLDCDTTKIPHIASDLVKHVPLLEEGDLVMADASEDYEGIGKSIEVKNLRGCKLVAGLHTLLLRGNKAIVADGFKGYLQYVPAVRSALVRLATGISVYGISKNNVRSIEVSLPGIEEQTAIAAVLSDMDAEIAALEARREKTRRIKQGMMQELLTGRTRLENKEDGK
jgi:type I restriction enzyme S subunit